ncbi:MAG TPA: hypothetical protein VFZ56_09320 [Gemmatimonadaceae bacterium]
MPDTDDGARPGAPVVEDRRHTRGASLEGLTLRDADLEPKRGIRYVAWLFKTIAVLLLAVMVTELALAMTDPASAGAGMLLGESVRLLAFAGLLWGAADLALMLIQSHYDLRATRILLARQNALMERVAGSREEPAQGSGKGPAVHLHREEV